MNRTYLAIIAAVLLIFAIAGCGQTTNSETAVPSSSASADSDTSSNEEGKPTPNYMDDASQTYDISTEYCTLQYPEKWKDKVETNVSEGEVYTVAFSATVNDETYSLFDICFGGEQGYAIGEINVNAQTIPVSVVTYELAFSDGMEQETQMDLLAMQEDVNTVIQSLGQYNGFTPAA